MRRALLILALLPVLTGAGSAGAQERRFESHGFSLTLDAKKWREVEKLCEYSVVALEYQGRRLEVFVEHHAGEPYKWNSNAKYYLSNDLDLVSHYARGSLRGRELLLHGMPAYDFTGRSERDKTVTLHARGILTRNRRYSLVSVCSRRDAANDPEMKALRESFAFIGTPQAPTYFSSYRTRRLIATAVGLLVIVGLVAATVFFVRRVTRNKPRREWKAPPKPSSLADINLADPRDCSGAAALDKLEAEAEPLSARERLLAKQRQRKMDRISGSGGSSAAPIIGMVVGMLGIVFLGIAMAVGGVKLVFSGTFLGLMTMLFVPGFIAMLVVKGLFGRPPPRPNSRTPEKKGRRIDLRGVDSSAPRFRRGDIPGAVQDAFDDIDKRG